MLIIFNLAKWLTNDYDYQARIGIYDMVVDWDFEIGACYAMSKSVEVFRPLIVRCDISVPLISTNGNESLVPFNITKCTVEGFI